MNLTQRFSEQYRANLDAYRQRTPRRILWLVAAFLTALLFGGVLHATKSIPILFYPTLALLGLLTILLAIWKAFRLIAQTRAESQYIFQSDRATADSAIPKVVIAECPPEVCRLPPVDVAGTRNNSSLIVLVAILVLPLLCLGGGSVMMLGFYLASGKSAPPNVTSPTTRPPGSEIPLHHREAINRLEQSARSLEDQLRRQEEQLRQQNERLRRRP